MSQAIATLAGECGNLLPLAQNTWEEYVTYISIIVAKLNYVSVSGIPPRLHESKRSGQALPSTLRLSAGLCNYRTRSYPQPQGERSNLQEPREVGKGVQGSHGTIASRFGCSRAG